MTLAEFWFLSTKLGGVKPAAAVQIKNKDNTHLYRCLMVGLSEEETAKPQKRGAQGHRCRRPTAALVIYWKDKYQVPLSLHTYDENVREQTPL